ncbi:MAG: hypothetical protein AAFN79_12370 [Pseudomonadota bacterium]
MTDKDKPVDSADQNAADTKSAQQDPEPLIIPPNAVPLTLPTVDVRVIQAPGESNVAKLSIAIAIFALVASLFSLILTADHNERSVYPNLTFHFTTSTDDRRAGLYLESAGSGPAVIAEMRIDRDGDPRDNWRLAKMELDITGSVSSIDPHQAILFKGDHLRPGERENLLGYLHDAVIDPISLNRQLTGEPFDIVVSYCSLYGRPLCARSSGKNCTPAESVKTYCENWKPWYSFVLSH